MKDRPADWASQLASKPLSVVLPAVAASGFLGLYVDPRGYIGETRPAVLDALRSILAYTAAAESRSRLVVLRSARLPRTPSGRASSVPAGLVTACHSVSHSADVRPWEACRNEPTQTCGMGDAFGAGDRTSRRQGDAPASCAGWVYHRSCREWLVAHPSQEGVHLRRDKHLPCLVPRAARPPACDNRRNGYGRCLRAFRDTRGHSCFQRCFRDCAAGLLDVEAKECVRPLL